MRVRSAKSEVLSCQIMENKDISFPSYHDDSSVHTVAQGLPALFWMVLQSGAEKYKKRRMMYPGGCVKSELQKWKHEKA